ncbi:MAG TPA: THUMP domain-containing protein [Polyangia bacterium]|nr:THUMP domain-containing protein [Polyangia bacterium]
MFRFFVTCARGTEGALRRELAAMRIAGAKGDRGGVWFEGPLEMGMDVCLRARVAVRVLLRLAEIEASDGESLYAAARRVPWRDWLSTRSTFAVFGNVRDTPGLTHSGFAALKVKDAVADVLREALGARPDVDPKAPDVSIVLHLAAGQGGLFLDLAGEALHRRGTRVAMVDAPLKETLAAAVLMLGGAQPELPFIDPMCGSGTLAIEHALATRGIAPGFRRRFGFERWPTLPAEARAAWGRMRESAEEDAARALEGDWPPVVCADTDPAALSAARQNAAAAGLDEGRAIAFERADVADLERRWPAATLAVNPPYGERLNPAELDAIYRSVGRVFDRLGGWRAIVLTANPALPQAIRKKPAVSHRLWNGPLEARLLRYDL